jgi:hypothetical protein
MEELHTRFLMSAITTRSGPVLRADPDARTSIQGSPYFYLNEVFGYVRHLTDVVWTPARARAPRTWDPY